METKLWRDWQKNLYPREIEREILFYLFQPFITLVLGSRQVGKTSLLRRLISDLIEQKRINPAQVLYFDFEILTEMGAFELVSPENIKKVILAYGANPAKPTFLFLDEIQYHQNPSNLLKVISDHLPQIKLVVSGSSSLKIKSKFKDSLAGRQKTFLLSPLSFSEFLDFKNQSPLKANLAREYLPPKIKQELKDLFGEYVVFGGYPKVVLSQTNEVKISVLESIFTSYVRRDIKDLAVIEEAEKFNKLVSLLAFQIGNLINLSELSAAIGLNRKTLEKYLFLLENTFIINLLKPYFINRRKEIVKMPKVYFQDTGLRNYVVNNFSPLEKRTDNGPLFENAIFNILTKKEKRPDNLRFWRTVLKNEVDFVRLGKNQEPIPYESKLMVFEKLKIPSGLLDFSRAYHPRESFVVSWDFRGETSYQKTKVKFLPGWAVSL